MQRFSHEKSNSVSKQLASILLFVALFCVFLFGISFISSETTEKQAETLELSISRSIAHCYATKGYYPENLDYILDNYGISYDIDKYFIDYNVLGENLFPDITIIQK